MALDTQITSVKYFRNADKVILIKEVSSNEAIQAVAILDKNKNHLGDSINPFFTNDFFFEIARGNISGIKSYIIVGKKDSISQSVFDDLSQIPNTNIILDPGGIQMELVSGDANDTSNGTGAQTVCIVYLDTSGIELIEIVILNGTTPVNTVATNIDKIQWINVLTVGSNSVAEGNISLRNTDGSVTYEYIVAGGNQSLSARYTIPTNKTGYITGWQGSGITKIIDLELRATVDRVDRTLITAFTFQDALRLDAAPSGHIPFLIPLKMPAGTQIKLSGRSSAATGDAAGHFSIILVDN